MFDLSDLFDIILDGIILYKWYISLFYLNSLRPTSSHPAPLHLTPPYPTSCHLMLCHLIFFLMNVWKNLVDKQSVAEDSNFGGEFFPNLRRILPVSKIF